MLGVYCVEIGEKGFGQVLACACCLAKQEHKFKRLNIENKAVEEELRKHGFLRSDIAIRTKTAELRKKVR